MNKSVLILILLFISNILLAQDEKKNLPSVELPDFVITGKDALEIKKVKKPLPKFVSTVSSDFFKPSIPPDELELREFPNPIKQEKTLIDSVDFYNGYAEAGAGIHSLPVGKIIYTHPFNQGKVFGKFGALNRVAHTDNSEFLGINAGAGVAFITSTNSEVLPGTQFSLVGDYSSFDYKLYGAQVPEKKKLSDGKVKLKINNHYLDDALFGLNIGGDFTSFRNEPYKENIFNAEAYSRFNISNFNLGFIFNYELQSISIQRVGNNELDFVFVRPFVGLNLSNTIKSQFGFTYTKSAKEAYSFPFVSVALRIDKNISIYSEYAPGAEFVTNTTLLRQNRYYDPESYFNILFEKKHLLNATLKYEFDKYFEIDAGFEYMATDNIPYFTDANNTGIFRLQKSDAVSYSGFINLLFHLGPSGVFYGSIEGNDTKNGADKFIPYYPQIKSSLNYGYTFNFGLNATATLLYQSKVFTDILNTNDLDAYFDLGAKFAYPISTGFNLTFELANLLSRKNYLWNGYKELPLDATLGVNFRW
ncbi:MAG: TonB-dependent receptor [Ignavibacteriales bacterium]|nr:MAG: TonB-dependent receptor [Ignavibacteriales bacterium]